MQSLFQIRPFLLALSAGCALTAGQAHTQEATQSAQVMQLITQAESAIQKGNLPRAESLFQQATIIAPTLSDGFFGLGLVQLREGLLDAAVTSLRKAALLNPGLQGPNQFLGIALYQTGAAEAAVTALKAELALNPDNVEALTWTGIAEMSLGRPEQACAALDHLALLRPNDPQAYYYRAKAHSQVAAASLAELMKLAPDSALVHRAKAENFDGLNQPERAIAEYQLGLQREPNNADLYEGLGEQEQKLSRVEAARQAYTQELRVNPGSGVAWYNLGKMDVEAGKAEAGVPMLRKAQAAHIAGAATDFYLGFGLAQLGNNEEASHWLEQALAGQPSSFIEQGALFQLGRVYQKLGRKQEAQRMLDRLKQLKASAPSGADESAPLQTPDQTAPAPAVKPE